MCVATNGFAGGKGWWYTLGTICPVFPLIWEMFDDLIKLFIGEIFFSLSRYLNTFLILQAQSSSKTCSTSGGNLLSHENDLIFESLHNAFYFMAMVVTGQCCFNVQLVLLFCSTREYSCPEFKFLKLAPLSNTTSANV